MKRLLFLTPSLKSLLLSNNVPIDTRIGDMKNAGVDDVTYETIKDINHAAYRLCQIPIIEAHRIGYNDASQWIKNHIKKWKDGETHNIHLLNDEKVIQTEIIGDTILFVMPLTAMNDLAIMKDTIELAIKKVYNSVDNIYIHVLSKCYVNILKI